MSTKDPIPVAFGCRLSSVIAYDHFISLLSLSRVEELREGEIGIIAAKGVGIMRGDNEKATLMKNCAILRLAIGSKIATVKVFKQYLHFCKVNITEATLLADFLCEAIKDTQRVIEDRELLSARLYELIKEESHIKEEDRESVESYFMDHSVCILDLTHEPVEATMTNDIIPLGTKIHTACLAGLLRDEKGYRRWIITFDNALALSIRLVVPYSDSNKDGYTFTIQPTGNILYSANDKSEEAELARKDVSDFIFERLEEIRLD